MMLIFIVLDPLSLGTPMIRFLFFLCCLSLLSTPYLSAQTQRPLMNNRFTYTSQLDDASATWVWDGGYRADKVRIGVFTKADSDSPLEHTKTHNSYNYANGNPILFVDKSGHMPTPPLLAPQPRRMIQPSPNQTISQNTWQNHLPIHQENDLHEALGSPPTPSPEQQMAYAKLNQTDQVLHTSQSLTTQENTLLEPPTLLHPQPITAIAPDPRPENLTIRNITPKLATIPEAEELLIDVI